METYKNPLGYEELPKLLKSFAVPSILAMLVSSLYNIVDQIFIGNGVGYLGNAATNVAYPLTTICMAIALMIGIGSASKFNLSLGAKDYAKAKNAVASALVMMVVLGVVYTILILLFLPQLLTLFGASAEIMPYALDYTRITAFGMPMLIIINGMSNLARADGRPKYSMACMMLGAVINTILDPIFIFVFKWGVAGAAWATVIGQLASCAMALAYIPKFKSIQLKKADFKIRFNDCTSIAALGMSNGCNQLAITLVQVVLNNTLNHYGALSIYGSDIPIATSGIVIKVNAILTGIIVGVSQGAQPILSFNYGAKNYSRVKACYKLEAIVSFIIATISFLLLQLFPQTVVSLFGTGDPLYFEFAVKFMRFYTLMMMLTCIQIISSNYFAATGRAIKGVFLSLSRQVLFLIPLLLILPLIFQLNGVLIAIPTADFLAFLVTGSTMILEMKKLSKMKI